MSPHEPSLDPDVADEAPTAATLTGYDHGHLVTYLRLLDADAEGPTGGKFRGSFCTSTLIVNQNALGVRSIITWPGPNG
jgi:hypothetical protein